MPEHIDLLQGTLDMLILKAVSLGPLHGYGVLLRVALILDIDSQAARTGLRSGRSVRAIAGPHRSLRARARSCTMC